MNRRSFLMAPALAALPNDARSSSSRFHETGPGHIRDRIGLVCQTFARGTVAFPDPMPAREARAMLSLSDSDLETPEHLLGFAVRWGVTLDWLIFGDARALIHDARMGRKAFATRGGEDAKK